MCIVHLTKNSEKLFSFLRAFKIISESIVKIASPKSNKYK